MRILLVVLIITLSRCDCPFNVTSMPYQLRDFKTIACSDQDQIVLFQKQNFTWYYSSAMSVTKLTQDISKPSSFIQKYQHASNIKIRSTFSLISYGSSLLYYYLLGSTDYSNIVTCSIPFSDFYPHILTNGTKLAIVVLSQTVETLSFADNDTLFGKNQIYFGQQIVTGRNINSKIWVFGSKSGKVFVVNVETSQIQSSQQLLVNDSIIIISMTKPTVVSSSSTFTSSKLEKVYLGLGSGRIKQYRIQDDGRFNLQRGSDYFEGEKLISITNLPSSDYMIVTDARGNLSQINISNGKLLDSVNISPYLNDKSDLSVSVLVGDRLTYFPYNSVNSMLFTAVVDQNSISNQIILSCYDMTYFQTSNQICESCDEKCSTCNPFTGLCSSCIQSYFLTEGKCLSCFYNSKGLTQHFQDCFSQNQQKIMQTSEALVKFLSVIVSNFATVMNICGLLFVFLKLINNWNILCLYFFPSIKLPFFLQNILQTLFTNFNSSVLKAIGIQLSWSLEIGSFNYQKYKALQIETDFLSMSTQPILLFLYSAVLTVTLYKFVNYLLAKIGITFFQQNTAISILQQFVGCFTVSLIPVYFVISNQQSNNWKFKINSMMYYLLLGISFIVPFCFLIFDYQYKMVKNSKIINKNQHEIASKVNTGLTKKIKAWREDDSKQNCLYALFSFTTAVLVCHPNPVIFIFGVGAVHILCLINVLSFRECKVNTIIQKSSFLLFHLAYSALYFLSDDYLQFVISIILVFFIIFIAVHQLIHTLFKKLYLIFIIIKSKLDKEQKVNYFFNEQINAIKQKKRHHPITFHQRSHPQTVKQIEITFKNINVKVVKTVSNFITPKKVKINQTENKQSAVKKIIDSRQTKEQKKRLVKTKRSRQTKRKIIDSSQ